MGKKRGIVYVQPLEIRPPSCAMCLHAHTMGIALVLQGFGEPVTQDESLASILIRVRALVMMTQIWSEVVRFFG